MHVVMEPPSSWLAGGPQADQSEVTSTRFDMMCAPVRRSRVRERTARLPRRMLEPAAASHTGSEIPTYTRNRAKRRAIIGSIITGTTIEWYDFYLYGWLFLAMQPHFFPCLLYTSPS